MSFGKISRLLEAHGFPHHGFARLEAPRTIAFYREWLARGDHADMDYLREHLAWKEDPSSWSPRARTAIVVALPYLPNHPYPRESRLRAARVAAYARGRDYHHAFLGDLRRLARALEFDFTREEFLCYADAAPILERDLAARAGIGWFGKNTCLIDPKRGSFFLIGQILTTLPLEADEAPVADHCGTCTRCLDACPTGALEAPRRLNARKCISYWTIEAKTAPPENLRAAMGDWMFGCDVCQSVCPWNTHAHGRPTLADLARPPERARLLDELRWLLTASHRAILRGVADTPLTRARPATLKRTALVVIANAHLRELAPEVERLCAHAEFKEIAEWTLGRLR